MTFSCALFSVPGLYTELFYAPSKKGQEGLIILQLPWQGPHIVIKQINDWVYRILLGPKTKPKVVHRNQL